ncbi:ribonuclease P protein component 2 [Candidatus Micrarchaeota archaeon]|nr:ribonuclease P protein component 2 [Candidatus Micrarchaeota archaeon]
MTLKPTLRENKRYVAFKASCEKGKLREEEAKRAVYSGLLGLLGELGIARTRARFLEFDEEKQTGIVQCERSGVEEVKAAIILISEANGGKARFEVVRTSGLIKKLKAFLELESRA